jgi:hypothetical protein
MQGVEYNQLLYSLKWFWPSIPQTGHTTLSSSPYWQLENQTPKTTGSNQLYNTLELLMMGIMVPETCWASNKICYKKHLLHLVGILFPHNPYSYWRKAQFKKTNSEISLYVPNYIVMCVAESIVLHAEKCLQLKCVILLTMGSVCFKVGNMRHKLTNPQDLCSDLPHSLRHSNYHLFPTRFTVKVTLVVIH